MALAEFGGVVVVFRSGALHEWGANRQIAAPAFVEQFSGATGILPRSNAASERETSSVMDLARVQRSLGRFCGAVGNIDDERRGCDSVQRMAGHITIRFLWDRDFGHRRNAAANLQRCGPQCILGVLH
jgi:hypothetical protein